MTTASEEIEKLFALMEKGAISRVQFEEQRDHLLAEARSRATPPPSSTPATLVGGEDLTGQRIGEYRLDRKLGEGGMGAVYLAAHQALGQQVAVKVLDPALARSREVRERFLQEARIQIGLRHPGIVQVLTANTEGPHLALVMEYIDGLSLAQVIERRVALPVAEALGLFRQVLDAVGHAHAHGVVHRDIKPSNIMVQADGTAKVMDFGIAKVVGGDKLTRTGTVMGSAHYMSPEQVLGQLDIDHQTDIYSLGVTIYEVLTGRTPFEGIGGESTDSDFLIKRAHTDQSPPDPMALRPNLPAPLAEALLMALAKQPGERFGSCEEFGEALVRPVVEASAPTPAPPLEPAIHPSELTSPYEPSHADSKIGAAPQQLAGGGTKWFAVGLLGRARQAGWKRLCLGLALSTALAYTIVGQQRSPAVDMELDAIADSDVQAWTDFQVPNYYLTAEAQRRAEAVTSPVFEHDEIVVEELLRRIDHAFGGMRAYFQPAPLEEAEGAEGAPAEAVEAEEVEQVESAPLDPVELEKQLDAFEADLGITLTDTDRSTLIDRRFDGLLRNMVMTLVERTMSRMIIDDEGSLPNQSGVGISLIRERGADREEEVLYDFSSMINLQEARQQVSELARQQVADQPPYVLSCAVSIAGSVIRPNLTFNASETRVRREQARLAVRVVYTEFKENQVIVRKGEKVTQDHIDALVEMEMHRGGMTAWMNILSLSAMFYVLLLALYASTAQFISKFTSRR